MKLLSSTLATVALVFAIASCSESVREERTPISEGTHVTVYATRGDAQTRSLLTEEGGNLNCAWQKGDQLLVTNTDGKKLGVLDLKDESSGKFEGSLLLQNGKMTLNYFFLGTDADTKGISEDGSQDYTFDLSVQNGTTSTLGKYDALSANAEISVINGEAFVNGTLLLERHFSFGHFTFSFPEGVTMTNGTVTISGLYTQATLGFTDRTVSGKTEGAVTVAGTDGDIFINIIPGDAVAPKFKATIDGKDYEGSLDARDIKAGIYLRKLAGEGVAVRMNESEIKQEDPSNPGNTDHWGGDNEKPKNEKTPEGYTKVADDNGWTYNLDEKGNGGYCAPITFTSNGIKNDLLTSNYGDAYFFQWGRWLGFPSMCVKTHFNSDGSASGNFPSQAQFIYGVDYYNDPHLGYVWTTSIKTSYATCWMGDNEWTPERANNCSIVFGKVNRDKGNLDYVGANEDCKWEDRSGNPCPDGYRIPTAAELQVMIPTSGIVEGSLAEIKEIDGIRYAMRWRMLKDGEYNYIEIKSIKTTASSVAVDDPAFDGVRAIRLYAYGYMNNRAKLIGEYSIGLYWSNESGLNEIDGTDGLGGKALRIDLKEGEAKMSIVTYPRSYGGTILPIKDASAKATPLTPWLPLSGK